MFVSEHFMSVINYKPFNSFTGPVDNEYQHSASQSGWWPQRIRGLCTLASLHSCIFQILSNHIKGLSRHLTHGKRTTRMVIYYLRRY
jgi:hypothetical protein